MINAQDTQLLCHFAIYFDSVVLITDTLPDYTCKYFLGLNIRARDFGCKSGSIGNDFLALLANRIMLKSDFFDHPTTGRLRGRTEDNSYG
jgi:hypothetical protein